MSRAEESFERRTTTRVVATADRMAENLAGLTHDLHQVLSASISDLQGDQVILELLRTSIEGNLATIARVVAEDLPTAEVQAPPAAVEYARRLAQRGISSSALLRAYRLGQENALAWALARIAEEETDAPVAYAAGQAFTAITFRYIDAVSEQVLVVYEAERERWLANRNTVRAAVLADLLELGAPDVGAAEQALGYRLGQQHVGVVLWQADEHAPAPELRDLELLLAQVGRGLGSAAQALFVAQDRATAWGWIPLAQRRTSGQLEVVGDAGVRIALGTPASGPDGFRQTHLDARRAQTVALVAGAGAPTVTSFEDAEVRAAALLAADLDETRRLVRRALGGLASDDEGAARLRETLRVFLSTRNSFAATARLVHLHKNTVKYRVDRAVEARGRPLDDERLDLELALIACRWLGPAALA